MKKFSIIIPNYNKGPFIEQCLNSVFQQTLSKDEYEVIVIDDGSTDNSIDIINNYDVILLKSNRLRAGGARNIGFEKATGEYIILLDSDDFFATNNVLSELNAQLRGEDIVFVRYIEHKSGKERIIMEDETKTLDELIYQSDYFCCTLKCFKRDLLSDIHYKERCTHEDIAFTISLMCKAKSMMFFQEPLYVYYKPDTNSTVDHYTVRKATDFLQQTLEYFYLADQYPDKKEAILKRVCINNYIRRINHLYDWVVNDKPYTYKEFKD